MTQENMAQAGTAQESMAPKDSAPTDDPHADKAREKTAPPAPRSVALIGGGAAATLFLSNLMRQEGLPPLSVTMFDRTGRFGTGIAYGTGNAGHLLNVRAMDMSGLHAEPDHFAQWLAAERPLGADWAPHDFAPRTVFGMYLHDLLADATRRAEAHGHHIALAQAEITGIAAAPTGGYVLTAADGSRKTADYALIATGNSTATAPPGADRLTAADGYYGDPWQTPYEDLARAEHIVILGTGLSMVDAIVSLDSVGFRGRVTAISRNGLLPAVHTDSTAIFPVAPDAPPAPTAAAYVRFVRAHARAAQDAGLSWQAAIGGLRAVTNDWWLRLPPEERRGLRRALPFWSVHRHRTAPTPGGLVQSWRNSGRLAVSKGRITGLRSVSGAQGSAGIAVDHGGKTITAPAVLNCLGYACAPATRFPGFGAESTPGLYGIGPTLCDRLVETTAVPEIRRNAAELADKVAALLRAGACAPSGAK